MPKSHDFGHLGHHFRDLVPHQKDVLGLDVAVDDAFFVGGVERGADLASDLDDFGKRQLAHSTEPLVQVFAFEQLHDDKRRAVFVLVKIGDLDDVGVRSPDTVRASSWKRL